MGKECIECGLEIVHNEREWHICLDCLINKLIEQGSLDLPQTKYNEDYINPEVESHRRPITRLQRKKIERVNKTRIALHMNGKMMRKGLFKRLGKNNDKPE